MSERQIGRQTKREKTEWEERGRQREIKKDRERRGEGDKENER